MLISIIIPTWNEEDRIGELVTFLRGHSHKNVEYEIIVVDAGSSDQTVREATLSGAHTGEAQRGRAPQMNHGAFLARGDILFFLHADTHPPDSFLHDIVTAVQEGYSAGSYRLSFDFHHWFL